MIELCVMYTFGDTGACLPVLYCYGCSTGEQNGASGSASPYRECFLEYGI